MTANETAARQTADRRACEAVHQDAMTGSGIDFEIIEAFFFAYRDFISDPDAILESSGFGRALALALAEPQSRRIKRAFEGMSAEDRRVVTRFLAGMQNAPEE